MGVCGGGGSGAGLFLLGSVSMHISLCIVVYIISVISAIW